MSAITLVTENISSSWDYFQVFVWPRVIEIVTVPLHHKQALWAIIPLLISTFLMQVYFGRNKEEELGWNTAYGNAIALMFISASLLKTMYETYGYGFWQNPTPELTSKIIFLVIIISQALLLATLDLFHSIPKKFSFAISSSHSVFIIAMISIVVIHASIPLNSPTLAAALFLFVASALFFASFRWLIPPSEHARQYLQRRQDIHEAQQKIKKIERYKKIQDIELHIKHAIDGTVQRAEEPFRKLAHLFRKD